MKIRKSVRKVFESKVFYIVFAILVSVTIWLYVAYVEDPDVDKKISGIQIEYLNEDYLTDRELVITDISTDTVTITFTGKRGTVVDLSNENLTVTVDLSEITTEGTWPLAYEIDYPLDVNETALETSRDTEWVVVTVDSLAEKEVSVEGTFGSVADGYQAEPMEITPGTITIYGPEDVVALIEKAYVTVDRNDISKTIEDELPFVLLDAEGDEVESDMLTPSQETVTVTIPIVMLKELPLTVNLTAGAGADETNTTIDITPSTIKVSGDAETLDEINSIPLGTIDLTSFQTSTTETFTIIIPDGTTNITGTTEATVEVTITGLETTHIDSTNIQTINVADGYTATVLTSTKEIVLRGTAEELELVTETNIRIVADLSEISTNGVFSIVAKVYVDGDFESVGAIGEYTVSVSVIRS